jgi:cyclopropane-fatty-acyl-phospholipid synthase
MTEHISPSENRSGASPAAISAHYDLSEDFFRLLIGPELIYSCAMFEGTDDLASAQIRKLDHHIAAAGAAGAARVLDIGCGWGAMLSRLVDHAGVASAVGLTLSPSQARWIRRNPRPQITVREEDWRDHQPEKRYNAIISIGAFEHFVHPGLDSDAKLETYREFFAFCDRVLVSRGRLSLQTIAYGWTPTGKVDQFIFDNIFADSDLPVFWEPIAAADGKFELIAVRNDREDYFRTLRVWDRNLTAHQEEAVALVGEAVVADFRTYLRKSAAAFQSGLACLLRITFVKTT